MNSKKHPNFIRYAGNLEKVSTARHNLGLLGPVAVTARYEVPVLGSAATDLRSIIFPALRAVIAQHPALVCGIVDEDLQDPAFIRLESIDLRECIIVKQNSKGNSSSDDNFLEENLSHEHSLSWPNLSTRPLWKLLVLPHANGIGPSSRVTVDISFLFHHALIDGLSGFAFHQSLLNALNNPSELRNTSHIIEVPRSVTLAPPVEDQLDLRITYRRLFLEILSAYLPASMLGFFVSRKIPWTGSRSILPKESHFISHLRVIDVNANCFSAILQQCKDCGSSFTAILHGIIVFCLSQQVPDAHAFVATTPYSVRSFCETPLDEIVNQVSIIETTYPCGIIEPTTRQCSSPKVSDLVAVGSLYRCSLRESQAVFPVDNMLGLLRYIGDFHAFFRNLLGKHRDATFEVSNLGVFRQFSQEERGRERKEWKINRILFTQAGSVVGNALSFNVASVNRGSLTVSLTWQDGAVETSLAEKLLQRVKECLDDLGAVPGPLQHGIHSSKSPTTAK